MKYSIFLAHYFNINISVAKKMLKYFCSFTYYHNLKYIAYKKKPIYIIIYLYCMIKFELWVNLYFLSCLRINS